ncbi:MAG TPA: acetyltransferase [Symbiobacteriaceae bacterium]|nr:acetyltransferase [Symbiobacteriaceae bacterium]
MPKKVAVVGTGGHSKVVVAILRSMGAEVVGLITEESGREGEAPYGVPVIGSVLDLPGRLVRELDGFVAARGENRLRLQLAERMAAHGVAPFTAVHPSAVLAAECRLGQGVVVGPGAILNPGAVVGDHAIINSGAIVEHDTQIGAGANLSPRTATSGNVRIGQRVFVGTGAVFLPGISVGADSIVGAGAVVTRDVPPGVVVVGVPARVLRAVE